MRLVRYNPFNELAIQRNLFNNFFNESFFTAKPGTDEPWQPVVDILNEKENVVLNIELPGMKKEDISVDIKDRVLTIKGERKLAKDDENNNYFRKERSHGSFKRSFSLSDDVLVDAVDADFKDGILKLTLKKDNTKEEVRQITIN